MQERVRNANLGSIVKQISEIEKTERSYTQALKEYNEITPEQRAFYSCLNMLRNSFMGQNISKKTQEYEYQSKQLQEVYQTLEGYLKRFELSIRISPILSEIRGRRPRLAIYVKLFDFEREAPFNTKYLDGGSRYIADVYTTSLFAILSSYVTRDAEPFHSRPLSQGLTAKLQIPLPHSTELTHTSAEPKTGDLYLLADENKGIFLVKYDSFDFRRENITHQDFRAAMDYLKVFEKRLQQRNFKVKFDWSPIY